MLIEFAMWSGVLDIQRNPIDLVVVKGATKRIRKPRNLTVEEFQKVQRFLNPPFDTMALLAVCLGLRVSELLALKWSDVDWLNAKRGIVKQIVDDVKTDSSRKSLAVDKELLDVLRAWKQGTLFSADEDWIFASPVKLGGSHTRTPASGESLRVPRRKRESPISAPMRFGIHTEVG